MKKYFIKSGIVNSSYHKTNFDLLKWLKKSLIYLNVTNVDPCCDILDVTKMPVVYNEITGTLQRFDSVTKTYINI